MRNLQQRLRSSSLTFLLLLSHCVNPRVQIIMAGQQLFPERQDSIFPDIMRLQISLTESVVVIPSQQVSFMHFLTSMMSSMQSTSQLHLPASSTPSAVTSTSPVFQRSRHSVRVTDLDAYSAENRKKRYMQRASARCFSLK